jgi:hypothetical protein
MDTERAALARRLFWWKTPEEALADQDRFLAQVMTCGTWRDIVEARAHWKADAFCEALRHAPPGVFDERSWTYWHYVLDRGPISALPLRKFADVP